MSAPRRFLDEGGTPFEMALLRSAKADGPPDGALERAMAIVGAGQKGPENGAKSAPTSSMAGSHGLTRWFFDLFAWISVTVIGGALFIGAPSQSAETQAPSVQASAAQSDSAADNARPTDQGAGAMAPSREAEAAAKGGAATDTANRDAAARGHEDAQARASNKATKTRVLTLADEIALLDEARRAIARGDSAAAIAALDAHSRDFASGSLRAEASVLRVDAMVSRGDRAGAAKAAGALLAADPTSPHASHLRAIQAASEPATDSPPAPTGQAAPREASPSP